MRGRLICFQPGPCAAAEKSPRVSRQTAWPSLHILFTAIHESVSEAESRPGVSTDALTTGGGPDGLGNVSTSTPISSGNVCAVTS